MKVCGHHVLQGGSSPCHITAPVTMVIVAPSLPLRAELHHRPRNPLLGLKGQQGRGDALEAGVPGVFGRLGYRAIVRSKVETRHVGRPWKPP